MPIVAREVELAKLQAMYDSPRACFMAVYGRRRVGKTYLISQYYRDKGLYFEVTGMRGASMSEQLGKYHREFSKLFGDNNQSQPKNWDDALFRLKEAVERVAISQKVILFFDELPWLATPRSGLLKEFDYYWNRHFSRMDNVILIICGSAAAWMIKHVIRDKGGLYGRLTDKIYLQPFNLYEVEKYLQIQGVHLSRVQIVQLYMVMGGVAKYLSLIRRGLSAAQIIDELCFTPQGSLLTEFNDLYHSLFKNAEMHIAVVRILASKRHGMLRNDILDALGTESGGNLTNVLDELEESGFVLSFNKFGQKRKQKTFRLYDEYSYFYLDFIESVKTDIIHGGDIHYWQKLQVNPRWQAWSGYAFENVCLKHIVQIKKALGLAAVYTVHSQWSYVAKHANEQGVQIDIIIDRADKCINLVEIKFSDTEFVISKEYAQKLLRKKQVFKQQTNTKKTIFITLITPHGAVKNQHYLSVVDNQLTLEDLFQVN